MTEVSKKLTVDFSRKGNTRPTFAVQNDRGARNLTITLCDDGAPYKIEAGTTAILNYKRPDGVCGALAADVGECEISVYLNPIAIGVVGTTVCTVSLFDALGNKLTSSQIALEVGEELYSGDALSESPEFTLLESVFSKLSGFEISENERVAAELERAEAETLREDAESRRDKKINSNLGIGGSIKLFSKDWTGKSEQEIVISGLGENDLVEFYPSGEIDRGILANYGVFIFPNADGEKVKARAKVKPIADISLEYFITRGRSAEEV